MLSVLPHTWDSVWNVIFLSKTTLFWQKAPGRKGPSTENKGIVLGSEMFPPKTQNKATQPKRHEPTESLV